MSFPRVEGYVVVSRIGSGSYSTVYKAYTKAGARSMVAIKCVEKSRVKETERGADKLLTEIRLLKELRHPNIVLMHDFLWDSKRIYIVMEYCQTDLSAYIRRHGRLAETAVRYFMRQLASALCFLRDQGVAHLDLKPHNLLLSKSSEARYTLKVADFGFAQYMTRDATQCDIRGSPLYMAPEMLAGGGYTPAADLWSFGVIMYECLFGHAPYRSATLQELLDKIVKRQPIEIPAEPAVSAACAELLLRLLQHEPGARLPHAELLAHPYLHPGDYHKGVELVTEATRADAARDPARALRLYSAGLAHLLPALAAECDNVRRAALRAKLTQYVERAEQLKAALSATRESGQTASPPAPAPARPRLLAATSLHEESPRCGAAEDPARQPCPGSDADSAPRRRLARRNTVAGSALPRDVTAKLPDVALSTQCELAANHQKSESGRLESARRRLFGEQQACRLQ